MKLFLSGVMSLAISAAVAREAPRPGVNRDEVLLASFRAEINGGLVAVGCGLRGAGPPMASGALLVTGLPADATVLKAILNWTVLDSVLPSADIVFHESTAPPAVFTGTLLGQDESPCWSAYFSGVYGFSADVTSEMTASGGGSYIVSLPDSGDVTMAPSAEGAALFVVFCSPSSPAVDIVIYEGLETQDVGRPGNGDTVQTVVGFDAPSPVRGALTTFVVSDGQGQGRMGSAGFVEGVELIPEFDGDAGLCASPDGVYFDVDTVDATTVVPSGSTSIRARVLARGDCVTWSAFALAIESDTADNPTAGCPSPSCPVSPRAEPGPPLSICAGQTARLDAASSLPCDATGLDYRWYDGATVVCMGALCDVAPLVTTTFTLEVRCIGLPSCRHSANVTVTVTPDVIPGDLGNTLRAVRMAGDVALSWGTDANAATYALRRGTTKGMWPGPPLRTRLTMPSANETDVAGPPNLYFYRAAGESCGGTEGD